jgi:hypothetical protein
MKYERFFLIWKIKEGKTAAKTLVVMGERKEKGQEKGHSEEEG